MSNNKVIFRYSMGKQRYIWAAVCGGTALARRRSLDFIVVVETDFNCATYPTINGDWSRSRETGLGYEKPAAGSNESVYSVKSLPNNAVTGAPKRIVMMIHSGSGDSFFLWRERFAGIKFAQLRDLNSKLRPLGFHMNSWTPQCG